MRLRDPDGFEDEYDEAQDETPLGTDEQVADEIGLADRELRDGELAASRGAVRGRGNGRGAGNGAS